MKKIIAIIILFVIALPSAAIDEYYKGKDIFPKKLKTCSKYKTFITTVYNFNDGKGWRKQYTRYSIKGIEGNMCRVDEQFHDKSAWKYDSQICLFPINDLNALGEYFAKTGVDMAIFNLKDLYCTPANVPW